MYNDENAALSPLPQQPGVLLLHLLNKCNLRCKHCYLDASPEKNHVLPLDLVKRSLTELRELGISTVYLSGGEPFMYQSLPQVFTAVSNQGGLNLVVCSNGTIVGEREAGLLKEHGASVQISIDGPAEFHDEFRGKKGAFDRTSLGIDHCIKAEVPVTIVTTISQDNIDSLPWLADWAVDHQVSHMSIQPLVQLGRARSIRDKKLNTAQLCDLFLRLSDMGYAYKAKGLQFSLTYRTRKFLLAHPCAAYICDGKRCHRHVAKEIKKLVIREDGTVLPEIPTLNTRFALGNIRDGSLPELVARYFTDGYQQFKELCQVTFQETMPTWTAPIVPWDELVSERSHESESLLRHQPIEFYSCRKDQGEFQKPVG